MWRLLVLALPVSGLMIHGKPLDWRPLDASTHRARALNGAPRLWLVQTDEHPAQPLAFLGQKTFLVKSTSLEGFNGNYTPFEAEHKYAPDINATLGVFVKFIDAGKRGRHLKLSRTKGVIQKSLTKDEVHDIARSSNVIWISALREHRRHSLAGRTILLGGSPVQTGAAQRFLITDTGLDPRHCMFSDNGSFAVSVLNLTGALPAFAGTGKILGIMPIETAPGVATNPAPYAGAHGTATAGAAAGYNCGGNGGVAPNARFLFADISYSGDFLITPPSWERVFAVANATGIFMHSASWGSTADDGVYDAEAHEFDEAAYLHDMVHIVSAGNAGPRLGASPATLKNGLSVGAGMSAASFFPFYDAAQRATQPLLYQYDSRADFSSRGPTADGRRFPLLMAPGVSIQTAFALAAGAPGHTDYVYEDGTSFSAPEALGAAAAFCEFYGGRPSAAAIMAALIASARPMQRTVVVGATTLAQAAPSPDLSYGVPFMNFDTLGLAEGQTNGSRAAFCFMATRTTLNVALAWVDPPAFIHVTPVLVNDLNLFAIVGNAEATLNNHLDNTELVFLTATVGATLRVVVDVTGIVSGGTQNFAVAVQGADFVEECGTCLSSDRGGCGAGFVAVCDGATGALSCAVESCADGEVYNGTQCVGVPASAACAIAHGSGQLVGGECEVRMCDANYVAADGACLCLPTLECDNGVIVACTANEFPSCALARPQTFATAPPTVAYDAYYALWGFIGFFFLVLFFFILAMLAVDSCWPTPPSSHPKDN